MGWCAALVLAPGEQASMVSDVGLALVAASAAAAYLRAVRRWSVRYRPYARLMAAACGSWAIGETIWAYLELFRNDEVPFPSLADVGFLGLVPFAIAALLTIPTPTRWFGRARMVLDGLIIAASVLVVAWSLVLASVVRNPADSSLGQVIRLAYPVGDVVIVTLALLLPSRVVRKGSQSRAIGFAVAGLVGLWVADSGFAYLTATDQYVSGRLTDTGWFVGFLLLCVAALQPSPAPAAAVEPPRRVAAGLPYLVAIAAVVVTAVSAMRHPQLDVVGVGIMAITAIFLAIRQYLSSLSQHEWIRQLERRVDERTADLGRSTEKLRASEQRFRAVVQNLADVIILLDGDAIIQFTTPSIASVLGYPEQGRLGTPIAFLVHPKDQAAFQEALQTAPPGPGGSVTLETSFIHRDGSFRGCQAVITNLLDDPALRAQVITIRDITERQALEQELTRLAFQDPLTGLPNREVLRDRLATALAQRRRRGSDLAVLYLDLDDFKSVNDSLGHQTGDRLLVAVADRLRECLRPGDTVARLGGDEFAVIIPDLAECDVEALADRVAQSVGERYVLQGRELFVAASVGVAVAADNESADTLLSNADLAMYRAKRLGLGRHHRYHTGMREAIIDRVALEAELHHALDRNELVLHYQPTIDLASDAVVGAEALIRWRHPTRGLLPPARFIPAAEQSALIVELGRWALQEACAQMTRWRDSGSLVKLESIAVNISGRHLRDPAIVDDVRDAVARSGLPPTFLVIEITEGVLVEQIEQNRQTLDALKRLGVRIALDDFGTGYSALNYLHRFPIDILKIDQSFLQNLHRAQSQSLARAIIRLGQALALKTIAEGVETVDQLHAIKLAGCSQAQGFHLCPPLESSQAWQAIHAHNITPAVLSAQLHRT